MVENHHSNIGKKCKVSLHLNLGGFLTIRSFLPMGERPLSA